MAHDFILTLKDGELKLIPVVKLPELKCPETFWSKTKLKVKKK